MRELAARVGLDFHVQLLGGLFVLCGALTLALGASMAALGLASALLRSGAGPSAGSQLAANVAVATFGVVAALALCWGGLHVAIGLTLRRRRSWARQGALIVGTVDLVLLPYGTALGAYALWTLLRGDAASTFTTAPPTSA